MVAGFDSKWLAAHQSKMAGYKVESEPAAKPPAPGRASAGKRADIGDMRFRSAWEANYARYLNFLVSQGLIHRWEYEPDTFWFEAIRRGVRSYQPDFKIWDKPDSVPYYHELKGYMDSRSKTKLKRMRIYHPGVLVVLIDATQYRAIAKSAAPIIPGWEGR